MPNPSGHPIWYELITPDPDAAKTFYDDVVGWTVEPAHGGPVPYHMIRPPGGGGHIGGMLRLDDEMRAAGAEPGWLFYIAVPDVDATAEQAKSLGGTIFVPPRDIPGTGRFSLLADPQGAPFYVMNVTGGEPTRAFAPGEPGRCSWNELWTTDFPAALAFYGALFGWENRETMDMGPRGGYHFLDAGETRLGAAAEMKDQRPRWNFYFEVPNLTAAIDRVRAHGGRIDMGPQEVPTGAHIALGHDPQTAAFSLVTNPKR